MVSYKNISKTLFLLHSSIVNSVQLINHHNYWEAWQEVVVLCYSGYVFGRNLSGKDLGFWSPFLYWTPMMAPSSQVRHHHTKTLSDKECSSRLWKTFYSLVHFLQEHTESATEETNHRLLIHVDILLEAIFSSSQHVPYNQTPHCLWAGPVLLTRHINWRVNLIEQSNDRCKQ